MSKVASPFASRFRTGDLEAHIWAQPRLKGSLSSRAVALGQRGYRALCLKALLTKLVLWLLRYRF